MPRYLLRFRVETCLTRPQDLTLSYQGYEARFLFSAKVDGQNHVIAEIQVGADNNRDAQVVVTSSVLPQMLDALSFSTGTPLLLGGCELVLKEEAGSPTRRAIYVGEAKVPTPVELTDEFVTETANILSAEHGPRLSLCWLRYALHRQLALDQFVFQWLSFEALAGDADVATQCPICRAVIEHCGKRVSHRSSDKIRAREIFIAANPGTSEKEFNDRIWKRARNSVFHGRNYPTPTFLAELVPITKALRQASMQEIVQAFGVKEHVSKPRHYEQLYRTFLFVEWVTKETSNQFAHDYPREALAEIAARTASSNVQTSLSALELKLLNYEESQEW